METNKLKSTNKTDEIEPVIEVEGKDWKKYFFPLIVCFMLQILHDIFMFFIHSF